MKKVNRFLGMVYSVLDIIAYRLVFH